MWVLSRPFKAGNVEGGERHSRQGTAQLKPGVRISPSLAPQRHQGLVEILGNKASYNQVARCLGMGVGNGGGLGGGEVDAPQSGSVG
jgi:hypothetical protein